MPAGTTAGGSIRNGSGAIARSLSQTRKGSSGQPEVNASLGWGLLPGDVGGGSGGAKMRAPVPGRHTFIPSSSTKMHKTDTSQVLLRNNSAEFVIS